MNDPVKALAPPSVTQEIYEYPPAGDCLLLTPWCECECEFEWATSR